MNTGKHKKFFLKKFGPPLGPTQPLIQWILWFFVGNTAAGAPFSAEAENLWNYTDSPSPYMRSWHGQILRGSEWRVHEWTDLVPFQQFQEVCKNNFKVHKLHFSHIVIVVIINRHQLGLDKPFSAWSNSLYKGLPRRLRFFGL